MKNIYLTLFLFITLLFSCEKDPVVLHLQQNNSFSSPLFNQPLLDKKTRVFFEQNIKLSKSTQSSYYLDIAWKLPSEVEDKFILVAPSVNSKGELTGFGNFLFEENTNQFHHLKYLSLKEIIAIIEHKELQLEGEEIIDICYLSTLQHLLLGGVNEQLDAFLKEWNLQPKNSSPKECIIRVEPPHRDIIYDENDFPIAVVLSESITYIHCPTGTTSGTNTGRNDNEIIIPEGPNGTSSTNNNNSNNDNNSDDPNSSIIDSLRGFPCAQELLSQLQNGSFQSTFLQAFNDIFGTGTAVNVTFTTNWQHQDAFSSKPSGTGSEQVVQVYSIGNSLRFNTVVYLNPNFLNCSMEGILSTMLHEAIHAVIDHDRSLVSNGLLSQEVFNERYPHLTNNGSTEVEQHTEIAENYRRVIAALIQQYNPNVSPEAALDLASVGLQGTTFWNDLTPEAQNRIGLANMASTCRQDPNDQRAYNFTNCDD